MTRSSNALALQALAILGLATSAAAGGASGEDDALLGPILDARKAEHMYNRLGFGARPDELAGAVGLRSTELLERWLEEDELPEEPELTYFSWRDYGYDQGGQELEGAPILELPREEIVRLQAEMRAIDKLQFREYMDGWFAQLVDGRASLRERLAFFWHGFFPTSTRTVLRRYEIIKQHVFLRRHALESYGVLLHGIVHDPAMLGFFDNDTNSKEHPNENFARELLELYSLGIGSYSEEDVRQAARALSGHQGESGSFVLDRALHDDGEKTILGKTGRFDGRSLADLLLEQEACARFVTRRLLEWLEGVPASDERIERYAALLRDADYELLPVLRALVADPEFFRDEVVGTRVQSPVDYLVGIAHRLRIHGREAALFFGAARTGQQIYGPPSVKGWDEGLAWITSSSLAERGNCAGVLLGVLQAHLRPEAMDAGMASADDIERVQELSDYLRVHDPGPPELAGALRTTLGKQATDPQVVRWITIAWLARPPSPSTRELLLTRLTQLRTELGVEGPLLMAPEANELLALLAHALFQLPIAQLA